MKVDPLSSLGNDTLQFVQIAKDLHRLRIHSYSSAKSQKLIELFQKKSSM